MKSTNIKSVLEKCSTEVFSAPTLEEAKTVMFARLSTSNVNEKHKKQMLDIVYSMDTLPNLQKYLCNAMLRFEGMSVNKYKK
jgi:hypothetical protein